MGDKQGCIGRVGQFYISVAGEDVIPESYYKVTTMMDKLSMNI